MVLDQLFGTPTAPESDIAYDQMLDPARLGSRIDALRTGYAGRAASQRIRNAVYLRWYSPPFDAKLGEHDQWPDPIKAGDEGHNRASYNVSRAVPEMWAALEAEDLPALRWEEAFIPTPVPSLDETENEQRVQTYRAYKLVERQLSTIREGVLNWYLRRAHMDRAFFRTTLRKNVFGTAWLKVYPDVSRQRICVQEVVDASTVYPVWSGWESRKLDAVLVAYREGAGKAHARFPDAVPLNADGITVSLNGYYNPTADRSTDADLNYVWIEDYWLLDAAYSLATDDEPIVSRVINALRVNGRIVQVVEYPGWTSVPYFMAENDNLRDNEGFSDVGTMIPFADGMNRMLSEEQDVIHGESRPKFVRRTESGGPLKMGDEGVIDIEPDESLEALSVPLNVYPVQAHGQALQGLMQRATGLPAVAWGEIQQAQNSGRALSTAWQATATRSVPRIYDDEMFLEGVYAFILDLLELYDWRLPVAGMAMTATALYQHNRDFTLDFPNKEPRDYSEVRLSAINMLGAGLFDFQKAMEETGETAPDEMIERVRADYMDPVLHPEKRQAFLLLERLQQQIQIEAQQAQLQQVAAAQQLAQQAASAPGGAPSGASPDQAVAASQQQQAQAQQQAAPTTTAPGQAPATQRGQQANAANNGNYSSVLLQGGKAQSRALVKFPG